MTPEDRARLQPEFQRRWLAGEIGPVIAEALGIDLKTVHRWRLALGLPQHGHSAPRVHTPEMIERLREMRAAGKSYLECGAALGLSKGSVAGMVARYKIPDPSTAVSRAAMLERLVLANAGLRARVEARGKPVKGAAPPPKSPPPPPEPALPRAPVVAVQGCQYPIGQPARVGFYFCGEARVGVSPYCADHLRLCWQRPPRRDAA